MRRGIGRLGWRPVAAAAVVGLAIWQVIVVVIAGRDVVEAGSRLRDGQLPVPARLAEVHRLAGGLDVLRDRAGLLDPWTRVATLVPGIGRDVGAARGWLGASADLALAGSVLGQLADPGSGDADAGAAHLLTTFTRGLRDRPDEAQRAAALLRRALSERRSWPAAEGVDELARADELLSEAGPAIEGLADALPSLAGALGANGPRRYLVLAQNNQELRPGGGFIGSYARVVVEDGAVGDFRFADSYEIDGTRSPLVFAPPPLREYFGASILVFRDLNWSPDFPTNARLLETAYEGHHREEVDGVIAIDLQAVRELLGTTGPVDIPEFGDRVSAENLIELTNQHVAYTGPGPSPHKELIAAVGEKLLERLSPPDPAQVPAIARAVWRSLATKHILVSVEDPDLAAGLGRANFDGHQAAVDGDDYLMVVDANLGYNKVNDRVTREVAHNVQSTDSGTATSDLSITYHFAEAPPARRLQLYQEYRSYVRVYLPSTVRLTAADGFLGPVDLELAGDKLVVGGFLRVLPGESRIIRLRYRLLGAAATPDSYRLWLQKQAGVGADRVAVRVIDATGTTRLSWNGELDRDRLVSVAERPTGRLAVALLDATDGILAGFVPWRRELLTVDNH